MNLAWQNFWKHPRTTASGFLSAVSAFYLLLMTDPEYVALRNMVPVKWAGRIATVMVAVNMLLKFTAKDTGREEVKIPGTNETKMEDSHEQPNDPKVVPVEAQK